MDEYESLSHEVGVQISTSALSSCGAALAVGARTHKSNPQKRTTLDGRRRTFANQSNVAQRRRLAHR
jgi:hypothetical protein